MNDKIPASNLTNKMAKKLYRIPVEWAVTGTVLVEAESLSEALLEAEDAPLPEPEDYIDGTFEINRQMISFVNKKLTKEEKDFCEREII
jgi:hypothetical protein